MRHGHTENGDSKDDTFYALIKLKILRNFMKVLPWNWLKWRGKSVPKECCGYFSHSLDAYEASHGQSPWISRHCCRNLNEKLQQTFL